MLPVSHQLKSELKSHIPSNIRPRCSQVRETRGTSNPANISKIHTGTPMSESENIPHRGT